MTEKFFAGMSKSMVRLALASAVGLCLAGSAWAADWPQYRGPNQDGVSTESILKTWPAAGLKTLWKLPMGEAFGTFAVRGDKTFLYSERGGNEVCLCLDVATGKELWATTIDKTIADGNGSGPRSTPVIDGQFIYVFSTYLKLSCLAAADGKVVWTHDLAKEFNGQLKTGGIKEWGNAQSALVEGNLVIVAGGGVGRSSGHVGVTQDRGRGRGPRRPRAGQRRGARRGVHQVDHWGGSQGPRRRVAIVLGSGGGGGGGRGRRARRRIETVDISAVGGTGGGGDGGRGSTAGLH